MQLYAGLPIITNKITVEEQQGIPHHLLGCIGLHEQPWVVGTFVRHALKIIEEIRSRGRLPILVGGTHYYTQSLLFQDRLAEIDATENKVDFVDDLSQRWPLLKEPTEVLLEELQRVDPSMADRWHPKDRRKIQRSLEIYLQTGRKASDIYAEQRSRREVDGGGVQLLKGPQMRFPTLVFWVHAEAAALRSRLDARVEKMLDGGLLQEVEELSAFAADQAMRDAPVNETKGIWVSIGYKEFKDYIRALRNGTDCDEKNLSKLKSVATETTQIATRQYAKRQLKWIRIKLLNALVETGSSDRLYLLNGTDVTRFDKDVIEPATELTRQFLAAEDMPLPASLSPVAADMLVPKQEYDLSATPEKWIKQHCEVCDVTCMTQEQWQQHTKSKAHRKLLSKQKHLQETSARTPDG